MYFILRHKNTYYDIMYNIILPYSVDLNIKRLIFFYGNYRTIILPYVWLSFINNL